MVFYICTNYYKPNMKKSILLISGILLSIVSFSQQQIGNSNFESWEASSPELHEPTNWNSFKTASGGWASFAGQQMDWSTSVRPGSTGTKSVWIWSNDVLGTIANGNSHIVNNRITDAVRLDGGLFKGSSLKPAF